VVWPQNHSDGFSSVWASKPTATVCEWFSLKTTRTVFASLASKLVVTVSGALASKPAATVFGGLASRPVVTVFTGLASKPVATVSGGLASKPVATIFSGLALKPVTTVFSSLASKLVATISPDVASKLVVSFLVEPQNQGGGGFPGLGLKKWQLRFGDLGLKITAMVFGFEPQNQVDFGLSVAPQNGWREVGAGHASGSSNLLHVEASLARVFQSGLKTDGDATVGGARGTIAEVAS
jgi:hypothetical protein